MSLIQTSRDAAGRGIPIIDLGPYLAGEKGALEATAKALGAACESLGFYFIGNHGVPQALIDRVFAEAARFHALPLERKLAVRCLDRVVGYLPLGHQRQRTSTYYKAPYPDNSSSYYIRDEYPVDHPDRVAKKIWVFEYCWPEDLPGFRETTLEYFAAMRALGLKLLPLQSVALGLPPDYLTRQEAFSPPADTLRLLYYPRREESVEGQYGFGPHTDYGYCTFLAQSKQAGLEVMTRDREWIEAPVIDGHFLVNNADMLRRWTNDRFRSAPHRVINRSGEIRYSIPFFMGPRLDVRLECLPTCQDAAHPPLYPPLSFGEYLAELTPKNYKLPSVAD